MQSITFIEHLSIKNMKLKIALIVTIILINVFATSFAERKEGFDKGVSWKPIIPVKRIIFVNFNENDLIDDYAFISSIPASIFYDNDRLYSHPLLFYQDYYGVKEEKEKSLNARIGIDYFMEDWMSYCNGELDKIILINVDESKIKWKAKDIFSIESNNIYEVASKIALHDWSYSDDVVIAIVDINDEAKRELIEGEIKGKISGKIKKASFQVEQTNSINPIFHEFEVPEGYKYVKAEVWWDCIMLGSIAIPPGDPDIQLYCQYGNEWMQAAAVASWNILTGPIEKVETYAYSSGKWRVGITDIPTEAPRKNFSFLPIQGSLLKILRNLKNVVYSIDVTMYPGVEINTSLKECENVKLVLEWEGDAKLGFSLIGPAGEEVASAKNESRSFQQIEIEKLGGCLDGENYSICVFALDNITKPVNFKIKYSCYKNNSSIGEYMASATNAAILASLLNAPLLYASPSKLPSYTINAIKKLGAKNIYVVDIGRHSKIYKEIKKLGKLKIYTDYKQIYNAIRKITGQNDVIFSTINPWSYWYVGELKPAGEYKGALFVAPAAYLAAHHGSPLIIVEDHPRLSSAIVWHNEFWRKHCYERFLYIPTVAEMYLTGTRVYDFLKEYGFDGDGMETIITVAGQYEIGIPWDRVFVGKAKPGRIFGSPVDVSYWISRCVFYPALIFQNPALNPEGITLINGSISVRKPAGILRKPFGNTLIIKRQSQEEKFKYPVLCSFVTHKYRFNERGSKYYGSMYQCANGLTPGIDFTFHPIDEGLMEKYTGLKGAIFPDMTESEIIPAYLRRGGYDVAFSTALEPVAENLNRGVILWIHSSHGLHTNGGSTLFWEPQTGFNEYDPISKLFGLFAGAVKEENPWRGYEWYFGSTEEPDTMSMDIIGTIPFTNIRFPLKTGLDYSLARKPIKEFLNRIIPFFKFEVDDRYDGVVGSIYFSRYQCVEKNASQIEALLGNLHSVGFITSICQTSNTYFHLSLIRHGSVFQIQDPWPTSWYGTVWRQSIPRDIILGCTIGEAYVNGISYVGILYITEPPQWWWDVMENVVLFGDPDLRIWVPSAEYSNKNHWEEEDIEPLEDIEESIDGHTLYGAENYPHEKRDYKIFIAIIIAIIFITIACLYFKKRR